jgi:hypothetical protein
MNARRCQGCAAPLPDGEGPEALRCRFCGLVHDPAVATSARPAIHVRVTGESMKRPIRWLAVVIALVAIVSLVPAVLALYFGWRVAGLASSAGLAGAARPTLLAPAGLRDAPGGNHDLDAAPPAGGFAAVDAVATLPWALSIAQSWSPDARLERIDVGRLRPDGTVNVQDDPEAVIGYRFRSPSRVAALLEQGRLRSSARSAVGLFLVVERGKLRALVNESTATSERGDAVPPHPSVLPLARLVTLAPVEKLLDGAPFLSGYLIHSEDEGWVWYFSTLAGESKPRVRGRDGAVWPYRRAR